MILIKILINLFSVIHFHKYNSKANKKKKRYHEDEDVCFSDVVHVFIYNKQLIYGQLLNFSIIIQQDNDY